MTIEYSLADGIATITINRPARRNALAPETMVAFREALLAFDRDGDARVVVITGAGPDAFCAGADIHETLPAGRSSLKVTSTGKVAPVIHCMFAISPFRDYAFISRLSRR